MTLDQFGWASVADVIQGLRNLRPDLAGVSEKELESLLSNSQIANFELSGSRIRARYGHSIRLTREDPIMPPEHLFHGTSTKMLLRIQALGLIPMARHYVHLSSDHEYCETLARKYRTAGIVLRICAQEAVQYGFRFWQASDVVWLAEALPAQFIQFIVSKHESSGFLVAHLTSPEKNELIGASMKTAIASLFIDEDLQRAGESAYQSS